MWLFSLSAVRMFECANCTFTTRYAWSVLNIDYGIYKCNLTRFWRQHISKWDHELVEEEGVPSSQSSDHSTPSDHRVPPAHSAPPVHSAPPDLSSPLHESEDCISNADICDNTGNNDAVSNSASFSSDGLGWDLPDGAPGGEPPLGDWHPFRSQVHCQLVLLYQGSHRRNTDLVTFRAFMQILKVSLIFLVWFGQNYYYFLQLAKSWVFQAEFSGHFPKCFLSPVVIYLPEGVVLWF